MKIWLDDQLRDSNEIEMDADGWPIGNGVFETIRTEGGKVYELARHMRRAGTAAKNFEIRLPSEDSIREAISALLTSEPQELGRLRLLFSKERFVAVHQSYSEITISAKLKTADVGERVTSISFKTFPYSHRTSLLHKAQSEGFDEIICINSGDEVTEGAVSNFIFHLNGDWVTTPLSAGVLPGVQRAIVIERCGVMVKSLARSDLSKVTSAIVISSLKIALPAQSIDDRDLAVDERVFSFMAQIRAQTQSHSVG
jgi:branched-chain amino acid aminotransferase